MSKYTNIDVIRSEARDIINTINTSIPAIVETYDSNTQLATVKVAVSTPTYYGDNIPSPVIGEVPVIFPSASDWVIAGDVKAGDSVLLVIPHHNTYDYVKGRKSKPADPQLVTKFDINDAVALVGMITHKDISRKKQYKDTFHIAQGEDNVIFMGEDGVTVKSGDNTVVVSSTGGVTVTCGATELVATSSGVSIIGDITVTGDINITGTTTTTGLVANGVNQVTHTHSYTDDGAPSVTGVPQ